ncbi:MAG: hypothetical protein JO343_12370 [Candidatus Eremiobacteraeota bacterium]|nr:hypothetical protein [Candidatus Eremiobacteraeota bacterium]
MLCSRILSAFVLVCVALCAFAVVSRGTTVSVATPAAQSSGSLSTADILKQMADQRKGLTSYSVPIHFNLTVHKGVSVSSQLDATRYFERPDKEVLVMKSMPSIARKFQYIYSGLGTPETWPLDYDITLVQSPSAQTYELKGVPKNNPNVSYVLLDVTRETLAPVKAQWFYQNGGTVVINFDNATVNGKYLLPSTETIDVSFPEYRVHAVGHYGDYSINQPIPDAVWLASPQPLPT